jgi:hypothetical protein
VHAQVRHGDAARPASAPATAGLAVRALREARLPGADALALARQARGRRAARAEGHGFARCRIEAGAEGALVLEGSLPLPARLLARVRPEPSGCVFTLFAGGPLGHGFRFAGAELVDDPACAPARLALPARGARDARLVVEMDLAGRERPGRDASRCREELRGLRLVGPVERPPADAFAEPEPSTPAP